MKKKPDLRDPQPVVDPLPTDRSGIRGLPIVLTVLLGLGISFLSFVAVEFLKLAVRLPERPQMPWISEYYYHLAELGFTLGAMWLLKKRIPGDCGLRLPEGRSYVGPALAWGLAFGVATTLVDYAPQLVGMHRPDQPYPLTPINIAGWFSYAGVFAGISEEVLFRGLLVTFLTERMPGRVSYRGYEMNAAGIVVAAIYALSFGESFLGKPLGVALGQLVYAFALGVLFAYWYEKSKSLLAPVIGHNVALAVQQALVFAMVAAFK